MDPVFEVESVREDPVFEVVVCVSLSLRLMSVWSLYLRLSLSGLCL